jgi:hypothetical protein
MHHGTILVDLNKESAVKYLNVNKEKLKVRLQPLWLDGIQLQKVKHSREHTSPRESTALDNELSTLLK